MSGLYLPLIARYVRKAGTKPKHKLTMAMVLRRLWHWLRGFPGIATDSTLTKASIAKDGK